MRLKPLMSQVVIGVVQSVWSLSALCCKILDAITEHVMVSGSAGLRHRFLFMERAAEHSALASVAVRYWQMISGFVLVQDLRQLLDSIEELMPIWQC
jgi:hypothetical protein